LYPGQGCCSLGSCAGCGECQQLSAGPEVKKPEMKESKVLTSEVRDLEGEEGDGVVGHGGGEIGVGTFGSGLTKIVPARYKVENESSFQSLSRLDSKSGRSGMKPIPAAKPEFVLTKRRRGAGAPKAMSLESIGVNNYIYDNEAGEFNEEAVDCGGIEGLVGVEELGKDWRFKLDHESECETEV
jgi:hypothetical protein